MGSLEDDPAARARSRCEGTVLQACVCSSLDLFLGADVWVVTALSLTAVGCLGWESGVALTADHLVAFVGASESSEGGLNLDAADAATAKSEHQMESGLLLDVVVRKCASILKLLASEDKSLLIGGNALLILDLGPISESG